MNERSLTQEIGICVVEVVVAFAVISVISYSAGRLKERRAEKKLKKFTEESA